MKKAILRISGGAIGVFALLFLAGWLGLRASLPELDGEISVAGLSASARIQRDAAGIPLISAGNRKDLAFAMGFAHGQDRFFQMDTIRRQAAGELSEMFGEVSANADKYFRFHRFRARAQEVLKNAPVADKALLESYADGVNAGLNSLGARPFEYFVLRVAPEPWLAEDSILAVYTMFIMLNDSRAFNEVRRGFAHSVLPVEVYAWMYPDGTPWDAPLMGESRPVAPIPSAEIFSLRDVEDHAPPANEVGRYHLRGSNNWVVSGAMTENGRAIVSNDMHLALGSPNIYYRARIKVDGVNALDVTGVTLPGAPFIIAGSNTQVAWGFTNSYGDFTDAVVLQPGTEEGTYKSPDGDLAFEIHNEVINVKGAAAVNYEIRETIWGPVLDNIEYPDGEVAVSWIAHKPESINLRILDLETAQSVAEALDIANTMGIPPQNFVTGDAGGNIAWTIAGKIPRKTEFDASLPVDWSTEHGWQGWIQSDAYPRIVNPADGRIWTANARVANADSLRIIGDGGYDFGARARQIRDALFAKETFVPEDMLTIQYDDRALFLMRWRNLLLDVLDDETVAGDAALLEYRQLVRDWIPRAAPESVGYRLVRAFRLEVEARVFHALMTPVREAYGDDVKLRKSNQFESPLWSLVTAQPMHMLPAGYDHWNEFLLAAVQQNIKHYDDNYTGGLAERNWGEINPASIRHPLSRAIPLLGGYLDMPNEPLSGDLDMPMAQGPGVGASERFSVSPGDEANSIMNMPTGPSGHPLSEFYGKGHSDWVEGLPSPFLPGKTVHTLTLVPHRL